MSDPKGFGNPSGRQVAIVTNSGGPGVLAADHAEEIGLDVAEPSPAIKAKLSEFLPAHCALKNPIDLTVEGTEDGYRKTLLAVAEEYDAVLALNIATPYLDSVALARGVCDAARQSGKPVAAAFCRTGLWPRPWTTCRRMASPTLPPASGPWRRWRAWPSTRRAQARHSERAHFASEESPALKSRDPSPLRGQGDKAGNARAGGDGVAAREWHPHARVSLRRDRRRGRARLPRDRLPGRDEGRLAGHSAQVRVGRCEAGHPRRRRGARGLRVHSAGRGRQGFSGRRHLSDDPRRARSAAGPLARSAIRPGRRVWVGRHLHRGLARCFAARRAGRSRRGRGHDPRDPGVPDSGGRCGASRRATWTRWPRCWSTFPGSPSAIPRSPKWT